MFLEHILFRKECLTDFQTLHIFKAVKHEKDIWRVGNAENFLDPICWFWNTLKYNNIIFFNDFFVIHRLWMKRSQTKINKEEEIFVWEKVHLDQALEHHFLFIQKSFPFKAVCNLLLSITLPLWRHKCENRIKFVMREKLALMPGYSTLELKM